MPQLMRRSMKRLKTFKQMRRGDSIPNDPNAIPLEEINGERHLWFTHFHFQQKFSGKVLFCMFQLIHDVLFFSTMPCMNPLKFYGFVASFVSLFSLFVYHYRKYKQ